MNNVKHWLRSSAVEWNISYRIAEWIFWVPIVGAVIMLLVRIDKDIYRFLLVDDGPVEWAQFTCFAIACVAGAGVASKLIRTGRWLPGLLFMAFAFSMFFIAGEEIAWGQRILGLETPESLSEINKQDEITLHNIGDVLPVLNVVMMLAGAFGSLAYLINRKIRVERYWRQANYLFVPPFFLAPAFLMTFLYKLIRFTAWQQPGFTVTKYGEWAEFCLAFGFAIFAWLNHRRLSVVAIERATEVGSQVSQRTQPTTVNGMSATHYRDEEGSVHRTDSKD